MLVANYPLRAHQLTRERGGEHYPMRVLTPTIKCVREPVKRGVEVLACILSIRGGAYVAVSKRGIRHDTLNLFDARTGLDTNRKSQMRSVGSMDQDGIVNG